MGMMNIQADQFWKMSLTELYTAIDGFTEFHGSNDTKPLERSRLEELMELYPD